MSRKRYSPRRPSSRPTWPPLFGSSNKFGKQIYETIEQLQKDLDEWIDYYNNERTHQGKICQGRTPMQTLDDGKRIWRGKFVA